MKAKLPPEIDVLREISSVLVCERNVRGILESVLGILEDKMGMLRGTFSLLDGDEVSIEASRGLGERERAHGHYRLGEGITGIVAKTGRVEVVPDIHKDRRFLNRTGARKDDFPVAFVCVPLVHLGQVIGTLSIDRPNPPEVTADAFNRDVALLQIIASITADAAGVCLKEREEREELESENRRLRNMLSETPDNILGNCREMRAVYEQIRQVAPSDATVLIRGSSGTGKELVARAIRDLSGRKDRPFVVLNCAALPETLLESELFGHEKGAFTDARERRIGRAEAADGGTLFLDEIGDLPVPLQVKLLRFLQERTFSRIGSNEEIHSDVRFIAATSRNLERMMADGKFREDLYYRLSVFPISMPDLAARTGDVLLLAEHFMERMSAKYGKKVTRISEPAVNMLLAWKWPGNVRELENCIERAVITASGDTIHGYNLPPQLQLEEYAETPYDVGGGGKTLVQMLEDCERRILEEAVRRNNGNRSAAGRQLGVSPRMMNYRLEKLGINGKF